MRALLIGLMGLGIVGYSAPSHAADAGRSCSEALSELSQHWDAMGFPTPQKPSQSQIVGNGGRSISGVQYQRVTGEMRAAAQDCAAGQEEASIRRIDLIESALSIVHNG